MCALSNSILSLRVAKRHYKIQKAQNDLQKMLRCDNFIAMKNRFVQLKII
jgi:hypothetical protein